jgi:RNA polymerase sigma-70 factor (ECF subfamily)
MEETTKSGLERLGLAEEAVRAAQRGDALAMNEVIKALSPHVVRVCESITSADAADAAQETLIIVMRNLAMLREPQALVGWTARIATRQAVRAAQRKAIPVDASVFADLPVARDPFLAAEIADVLQEMTPDHRAVLVLREYVDLDEASIADLLGVSCGTVKSRLHRARARFREHWSK